MEPDPKPRRRSPDGRSTVAVLAGVVLIFHVVVALSHGGPVAVPDVPSYLAVAQWVAGGLEPPPFGHHPGYGLLLSPLALTGLSPDGLHTAALLVNAVLASAAVMLAWSVTRRLSPTGSELLPLAAAVMAALHPSLSSASRVAWPEALLIVMVLATSLVLMHALGSTATLGWFALVGWLGTIGVAVHPRMVVLGLATALAVAVVRPGWKAASAWAAGAAGGAAMTLLALAVAYNGPAGGGRLAGAVESAGQGAGLISTVPGQLAAVAAGTAGLALIGLLESARRLAGVRIQPPEPGLDRDRLAVSMLIGAGAVGTVLLAGASLVGSDRADTFAYGRYIDAYTVALVVLALGTRAVRNPQVVASALVVVTAATALVWMSADLVGRPGMRLMVLGTDQWWRWSEGRLVPALLAGSAAAALGLGGWLVAQRNRRLVAAPLVLAAILMASATVTSQEHLSEVGRISGGQATAATVVRKMGERAPACLAHDRTDVSTYVMWLYRMQLPDVEHRRVDLAEGERACSPLVVAHVTSSVLAHCDAAVLLAGEPMGTWGLWESSPGACAPVAATPPG